MEDKEEARSMLPPLYREGAKIITLQRFGPETLDQTMDLHQS